MSADSLGREPKNRGAPGRLRSVVITGASSGLGRELALTYSAPGVLIALIGRNPQRLAAVAQACRTKGAETRTIAVDVSDARALGDHLRALDAERPVGLLIANAGIFRGPPDDGFLDGLEPATSQVTTNLLGVMHAVEALAPAMIARRSGQIAMVSSVAGYRGMPYTPAYAAAKAGVRVYGEAVRARLAPVGVSVSVVVPGFFDSPMTDTYMGGKPLMMSTASAAARVRRGLDRRRPRIVFPRRLGLLLQLLDVLPARMGDAILMARHVKVANRAWGELTEAG